MDPVTLILTALAAGAGIGAKDMAKAAVNDGYQALKGLIARRFAADSRAIASLEMYESSPDDTIASYLKPHLLEYDVVADPEIMAAAEDLLARADSIGATGPGSIAFTGSVVQTADRGGVAQFGGNVGSISTNFNGGAHDGPSPRQT